MTTTPVETPKSPWWLAFRVFDEPGQVFAELAQRPRGLVPLLLLFLCFAGLAVVVPSRVLQSATTQQLDALEKKRPGVITPEAREKAIAQAGGTRGRINLLLFPSVFSLIFYSLAAAILSLIFNSLSGTEIGFRDEWAIVTHANMALLVGTIATWIGIVATNDMTFRVALGFLIPRETSAFGHAFMQQMTVFGAWNVYLLALGNQVKMKTKGIGLQLGIIGGFWMVLSLLVAWLSSLVGGMMG